MQSPLFIIYICHITELQYSKLYFVRLDKMSKIQLIKD